jgi:hypothetical protein
MKKICTYINLKFIQFQRPNGLVRLYREMMYQFKYKKRMVSFLFLILQEAVAVRGVTER